MTNKLIVIGFMGDFTCYLNITRESAVVRYEKTHPWMCNIKYDIYERWFEDEFEAYEIK